MLNTRAATFYKISPSGNTTLLFEGLHYTQEEKNIMASTALKSTHLGGEQAGFIDIKQGILHMAGGEFCANATRSLALLMAMQHALQPKQTWRGQIKTSGFSEILSVKVQCLENGTYDVTLYLPLSHIPKPQILAEGKVLMALPGIDHLLIDASLHPFEPQHWQAHAQNMRKIHALEQGNAVGCIWWEKQLHAQDFTIHPVVMVPDPYTECYENACGSGTMALALYLYSVTQQKEYIVQQPGGFLSINIEKNANNTLVGIGGMVSLVAKGQTFL